MYVNIGMCSDYWITLHDPVMGRTPQKPFDIAYARANCADWRATEARMTNAEAFLKTMRPIRLSDAPGGSAYLTSDAAILQRGKIAFADKCAQCHSSAQPPADAAADLAKATAWYRESVLSGTFLDRNFLSDDRRYPVSMLGTNIARAVATNATAEGVWAQFSSVTYKNQTAIGRMRNLYNPRDPDEPIDFELKGGGRGYYRTPTLISMWATAPYLHNNALGTYIKDPSVRGRMLAFQDAVEKREVPRIARNRIVLNVISDKGLFRGLVRRNQAPDFVLDRGHLFGTELPDEDKRALIEFLKTF